MSASLATLAPDCISNLILFLNGDDFAVLMCSGDRLLRHKIHLNCYDLFFPVRHATKFPLAALSLPQLRSFRVSGIRELVAYLDFGENIQKVLSQGCKTLQKLELQFRNCAGLFLSPGKSIPRLPIRDRFPSLSTLILDDIICTDPLDSLFGEFPEILTTLSFTYHKVIGEPTLCLSCIEKLPRNLTSLTLSGFRLSNRHKRYSSFENLFPPHLEHLEIVYLSEHHLIDHFPSSLKYLRFEITSDAPEFEWRSSKIPPTLVSLEFALGRGNLVLDVPLPSTLENLEHSVSGTLLPSLENLPRSLKSVPGGLMARNELKSILDRFPNLQHTTIIREEMVPALPKGLKSLYCQVPLKLDSCALPSGLKSLTMAAPSFAHTLHHIPSSLTTLRLGSYSFDTQQGYPSVKLQFPPWSPLEYEQLASRLQLVNIYLEMKLVWNVSSLRPLSTIESLEHCSFLNGWPLLMETAPDWLPQCLPKNLTSLSLLFSTGSDNIIDGVPVPAPKKPNTVGETFLSACNLAEVTPKLQMLSLNCASLTPVTLGAAAFASLPRGLLELVFHFSLVDLAVDAISQLPRTIVRLHLGLNEQSNQQLTNYHFAGLPEKLAKLTLWVGSKASIDDELLQILPKSIVALSYISGAFGSRAKTGFADLPNFLGSNPLSRGFC